MDDVTLGSGTFQDISDVLGETSAVLVDGDEIYIADFRHSKVEVHRFAGSEA